MNDWRKLRHTRTRNSRLPFALGFESLQFIASVGKAVIGYQFLYTSESLLVLVTFFFFSVQFEITEASRIFGVAFSIWLQSKLY
jgi:hypothetical protein